MNKKILFFFSLKLRVLALKYKDTILKILLMQLIIKYHKNNVSLYITSLSDMENKAFWFICLCSLSVIVTYIIREAYLRELESSEKADEARNNLNEVIEKNELIEPLKIITMYDDYRKKEEIVNFDHSIFVGLCIIDLMLVILATDSFIEYRHRVELYRQMLNILNRPPHIREWREDGNQ